MAQDDRTAASHLPQVRLFTTGGTIASRRDPATGAVAATATGEDLLQHIPGVCGLARIAVDPVTTVNGWNMTPQLMFELTRRVGNALGDPDVDAAIVTHGTDTVEETALMTDILVSSPKPVVFAVAMRHLDELGTDGPRNFRDAVAVAAHPASAGRGALLVANGTIHAARAVMKVLTTNLDAFASPGIGREGFLDGTAVRYHHAPQARPSWEVAGIETRVLLIKTCSGMDDSTIRWGITEGYRGVVLEGTGSGNVPATMMPGVEAALRAGIAVVLSTRVPDGPLTTTYGGGNAARGGGHDLAALGVIPATGLPGHKARILLMVALGLSSNLDAIRGVFHDFCRGQA